MRCQVKTLVQLKKMYREYVLLYKRKLYELSGDQCDDETESESSELFSCVNRDDTYLMESAASFARKFNMEESVKRLYGEHTMYAAIPKKRTTKKNARRPTVINIYPSGTRGDYLLQWPIDKTRFWMSSKFGPRRKSKKDRTWKFHYGIDLAAIKGTPVKAAADGRVIGVANSSEGYGRNVVVKHKLCQTRYAHLDKIYVKIGEKVHCGKVIASVGNSGFVLSKYGLDNASHLHFEVKESGKHIDPLLVLA